MAASSHLYIHPRHGAVEIKQGFCWPAFFFGALWAGARRVYPLFFVMSLLDVSLWALAGYAEARGLTLLALLGLVAMLVYMVVRGWRGNRWVAAFLVSRGYVRLGADT